MGMDDEQLEMALRISLEEEQRRQAGLRENEVNNTATGPIETIEEKVDEE
jgi:hypothetical protein